MAQTTYSINARKLRDWMARHRLTLREVAEWWECSGGYISKFKNIPGQEPGQAFARDVQRCMKENVPEQFCTEDFSTWGDWYEYE